MCIRSAAIFSSSHGNFEVSSTSHLADRSGSRHGTRITDHELLESEVALVRRILQGETELYYQLVPPYRRMIYASASSILRSEIDAEDVVQQTFLNGLVALRSFRAQSRISTWLTQIAINGLACACGGTASAAPFRLRK